MDTGLFSQEQGLERVGDTRSRKINIRIVGPAMYANPRPTIPTVTAVLTSAELKQRARENLTIALTQARGKVFGPSGAAALLGMKPTRVISRIKA